MMTQRETSLYQKVVAVTADYLGPVSGRFIDRQIETHLGKPPEELTKRDLVTLIDWLKMVMAILTEDHKTVDDFTKDLMILVNSPAK